MWPSIGSPFTAFSVHSRVVRTSTVTRALRIGERKRTLVCGTRPAIATINAWANCDPFAISNASRAEYEAAVIGARMPLCRICNNVSKKPTTARWASRC
eukprot:scaffold60602_cov35-Tisochrysis_lutea.AAC.2